MSRKVLLCAWCRHVTPDRRAPNAPAGERLTCAAFPAGIPRQILRSRELHLVPRKGDGGIVFAPVDGADPDYTANLIELAQRAIAAREAEPPSGAAGEVPHE